MPLADIQPEEKQLAGKEVLYRVDFFREGEAKVSFGILPVVKKSAPFLALLEDAVKSGDRRAGHPWLCDYLKFHSALCGLEALARRELSFAGQKRQGSAGEEEISRKTQDGYTFANTAYYSEVLSYVRTGRDILNACPAGTPLPPFPDRSAFMAKWYRENGQESL